MNQIQSKKKDILKTGSRDIGVNWFFSQMITRQKSWKYC